MKTLSHLIFLWYIQAMNYEILSKDFTDKLLERFLRYTLQWTTSDSLMADQGIVPSTERQRDFAQLLAQELKDLGLTDVSISDHCYLCARLPATPGMEQVPAVGFLAHMDTSEEVSGENVQPQVIRNYDGNPVRLAGGVVLDPAIDTKLRDVVGGTIITSDGTTLLGSDDKAGVAIIMTGLERIIWEERPHGTIEIIFSPDEETGHGMDFVPLDWLTAKQCYTFDGSTGGEIEDECFNAWKSEVVFTGKAKHTGSSDNAGNGGSGDSPNGGSASSQSCSHQPEADDGDCTTEVKCTVCGEVTIPARDSHTGGTATCVKGKRCETCGHEYSGADASAHLWGAPEYILNDDRTKCTATASCQHDNTHKETETVEATPKDDQSNVYTLQFKNSELFPITELDLNLFVLDGVTAGSWGGANDGGGLETE